MGYEGQEIHCSNAECTRTIKNHYWGKVEAQTNGWFFQKDGTSYCLEHTPEWVAEWRKKSAKK